MNRPQRLIRLLRPWRHLAGALEGFAYDAWRYARYGGWSGPREPERHEFRTVKTYHRLEKSLAFAQRRAGAGWAAADDLVSLLQRAPSEAAPAGMHAAVGVKVLHDFRAAAGDPPTASRVPAFVDAVPPRTTRGGALSTSADYIRQGRLDDPERFFESRHSVRDFSDARVEAGAVERAIALAMRSPSVCNRQAWHVYRTQRRETIDRILARQDGNAGFGHTVPCLLVLTADLRAFDTLGERYQHWIDGGMFAMALVMALHSLGLATCCLNWSRGPRDDRALRRAMPLAPHHTVIMMLAVGHPSDTLKVCYSARRAPRDILTDLDGGP
ncbi:nitroreductase family protein [Luteibacter sp. NPDC031894]|uniref:nitroreductase family protein n=1 Tax=Luteibacter sp. NPDC031894 TaxID=3390572 RepID=UPI003CFD5476